ncbi:MAG: DegT/DnrJ/EryC1/StrS family aminotransferase, partial [Gammaproteobacteria bacterium]|nr:DegT/DnrJ/EryC1/StrS family aminotransferase [Gammaproteobacteria bacterium]
MFYHLPPVGNRVCLSFEAERKLPAFLSAEKTRFYASGTAALAAAIMASISQKGKSAAEVILPAYACPDLVSAVCYAGATPVLVDTEFERPWFDLQLLLAAITENTVALVGVNLFGLSERWQQLRELVRQSDIVLIEDSAQYFPMSDAEQSWQGDLVVLSFGRGKPVGLLGGGAVFANRPELSGLLPAAAIRPLSWWQKLSYNVKVRLYNVMISPRLYWLPQALSFLHLGETRYHALHAVEAMDQRRMNLLASNINCYKTDKKARSNYEKISSMLASVEGVIDLPRVCRMKENRRLLRYPLLLPTTRRDRVYHKLQQAGLGASVMYPASLPGIKGIDEVLYDSKKYVNAEMFAAQILTLPLHAQVSDQDIQKMQAILM